MFKNDSSERFSFGKNWSQFLAHIDNQRILQAEDDLKKLICSSSLTKQSFLDIGSGSGLSSLCARRLGAKVTSFDYDQISVDCTNELKRRYFTDDPEWKVMQGSALDAKFLNSLNSFDIVYSWGVLHHTGEMWKALELLIPLVKPGGKLCLAIYNDQGVQSKVWWHIKRFYNRSNSIVRAMLVFFIAAVFESLAFILRLITLRNPFERFTKLSSGRGMSVWYDWIDWVGGFPFEVSTPEKIFDFYSQRGFTLKGLKTKAGGWGCCEYLFVRNES
jgi:SAM-dependent methyltransferase